MTANSGEQTLQQLMALFEEAVALAPGQRAAFVDRVRASDHAMADELQSLLAAYATSEDFLEPIDIGRVAVTLGIGEPADNAGVEVGAYRIIRELGRGGMGVVYVASRADGQFDQHVALKLIKRGMDSDEVQRRFRTERQILAQLNHPNIARLLDGGITDNGQLYFAMEYVEGTKITDYCDEHQQTIAQRLALFLAICRAVQHAHNRLVVHRDIKPSNILVDAEGRPKLLDFGIARLLDSDSGTSQATQTAVRALTPEYASPEQLRGEPISTASDIYQLGLLLYRLLTGISPFADGERNSITAPGTVSELAPRKPSSVVTSANGAKCQLPPKRLARRLAGDLDNIVLMALRSEPERRYQSVGQLASDVERHLQHLPVIAQPDSARYRAAKFVQRHKLGVAATALLLLALVAGIAGTTWQARIAALQAQRAAQIKDFALDLLALSDPDAARGHRLTVSEMLASGADRVQTELAGQPELQAEMLTVLGNVHGKLGNFAAALEALERALELRRSLHDDKALPVAESLGALGTLRYQMHDFAEAENLLRQSLAIRTQLSERRDEGVANLLSSLGSVLRAQGRLDEAGEAVNESLRIREQLLGARHPAVADALTELGVLARRRGDLAAARRYQEQALSIRREAFGEQHYRVAESLKNLALVLHHQEELDRAENHYRQALAIQRSVLGETHPSIASTLNSLASLLHAQRKLDESRDLFEESLIIGRNARGPDDLSVARTLTNYGGLLFDSGDFDESIKVLREALDIKKRTLAADHPSTATTLNNLASMLGDMGRPDEAWPLVAEAADIYRNRLGNEHPFLGIALINQSRFELDAGLVAAAEQHALEAKAVLTAASPDKTSNIAMSELRLAEVYLATGRAQQARPLLEASVAFFNTLDWSHKRRAESENALGDALSQLGEAEAALKLLLSSYEELETRSLRVRNLALRRLADHYERNQQAKQAEKFRAQITKIP